MTLSTTEAGYVALVQAVAEKALLTGAAVSFWLPIERSESSGRVCSTTASGPQHPLITFSLAFSARGAGREIDAARLNFFREHIVRELLRSKIRGVGRVL